MITSITSSDYEHHNTMRFQYITAGILIPGTWYEYSTRYWYKHEPVVILISPRGTRARHQPHEMLQYSSKNKRMWACVTFKVAATRSRARCGFTDPHLWQLHNYVLHQTVRILILIVQIQRVFTSILSTYMSHSELQYLRQSFTYAGISLRYRKLITIPVFYCAVRTVL